MGRKYILADLRKPVVRIISTTHTGIEEEAKALGKTKKKSEIIILIKIIS